MCSKSPKPWCLFMCILTALIHGVMFVTVSILVILHLKVSHYFPILRYIQLSWFEESYRVEILMSCSLILVNFLSALPYVIIGASGTKEICSLAFTLVMCTLEILAWMSLFIYTAIHISVSRRNPQVVAQWLIIAGMIIVLLITWLLLLLTWRKRRHEYIIAVHTARLISERKNRKDHQADLPNLGGLAKLVHEELALQWGISSGPNREVALSAAWFFLELMIKAMIEHLATTSRLGVSRKHRFSEQFHSDLVGMVASLTSDIVCLQKKVPEMVEKLNSSLAFFLHDLLSVMDRGFVFSLIRSYMKDVSSRMTTTIAESLPLWNLQLDFVRIICSHEHFVSLNLPSVNPSLDFHFSGASSPTPSVRSTDSQSSFIAHSLGGSERTHWADLTNDFRKKHFLVGLVLSLLSNALDQPSVEVHGRAVNAVRNLLWCHDSDDRYKDIDCRARVASLYLPFISILMDHLAKLYSWPSEGVTRIAGPNNPTEHFDMILSSISSNIPHPNGPILLKEETTKHLLICFLWVIKHLDKSILKLWWSEISHNRLQILLEILRLCVSCFQYKGKRVSTLQQNEDLPLNSGGRPERLSAIYDDHSGWASTENLSYLALETRLQSRFATKGKKAIRRHATLGARKSSDMRSKLEDIIMGPASNRQEMLQRASRKERTHPPSPNPDLPPQYGGGRRWQKTSILKTALHASDSTSMIGGGEGGMPKILDPETDAHVEGVLATEASMLVLDTLEIIVQIVSQTDHASGLLASVLRVLLHALGTNQSTFFLQHLFAVQRSFVFKFPSLLFDEASEHCADLCLRLLKHCSSSISAIRSQASASLYLLMRQNFEIGNNFARVKMQVTMSLSKLVGTISNFNEDYLRKSLKTILVYAEQDHELSDTSFPEQVQDLVYNLHMILSDTVKMKEYIDDPEMHLDLMYRIAKGYQNNPDLRLTWLESMATKHEHHSHFAEAGMCKIHCAALISEYLHMLEDRKYMPTGAVTFSQLTPNALEESAVSDDVVSPDEEGICTGKNFTEVGLMAILDEAAKCFSQAGMFETVNEVFKVSIPIAEASRNFKKLADVHKDLHEAFLSIDRLRGKRMFGTFFRVGFYGARFGDLDGEEYVYKEKPLAKLPEIAQRLEGFYGDKFGRDNVMIIKDSKMVELSKLNPEIAYIQITYVEPFFDNFELRDRKTIFEKNSNISEYLGSLFYFTIAFKIIVLTPIEVAIEDVQKKIYELEIATLQDPPDPKILQMVLQGCIGTTVNQGPMEVANVFLKDLIDGIKNPTKYQNKLRLCFKDFTKKCEDALKRNRKLITSDQKEYQKELEKNYLHLHQSLAPLFSTASTRQSPKIPVNQSIFD
eukprot:snap_masked-scaffold265_size231475-processed-gene-1.10 protein:Tk00113 transcript:snap_masked-scaffold265_size231475-processed-gene-1.10-mRNA-1 annotation:"dedicator of cytokinesis protein 7-like isoform x2"